LLGRKRFVSTRSTNKQVYFAFDRESVCLI
jgi:hypothetical protein